MEQTQTYDECPKCHKKKKSQYATCFECGKEEKTPQETKKKDEYRDGQISGHIQKLSHEYALKYAQNKEDYWILLEKVLPVFEKRFKK